MALMARLLPLVGAQPFHSTFVLTSRVLENTPMQETWQCMEELVDQKIAKNIGIR